MATESGNAPLIQLEPGQIPDEMFVRCPKWPRFDYVQVRDCCVGCPHHLGFVRDASAPETAPLFGSACAFPIARWWRKTVIHKPGG